jgi:hypothetical protein
MKRIKSIFWGFMVVLAKHFGYTLMTDDEATCYKAVPSAKIPTFSMRISDGAELLALKVWTENEKPCPKHCYHKVKALNSHMFAVRSGKGSKNHLDYACCKCTHKLCSMEWEATNA